MNADLKEAFSRIKPVCDRVMVCPTEKSIVSFTQRVSEIKVEALQELQQYILFPFITHVKSEEIEKNYQLQNKMTDTMRLILEKVTVTSFELCMKIETALLSLVFDNSKTGMVAEIPEELKLSVMQCLTMLMLKVNKSTRESMLKTQVPTIAQAVFVAVHIAKLDKLRSLRLAAIECLTAHTVVHPQLTDNAYHITDPSLELLAVDTLCNILPGVLAALQDVATDVNNPGHAVVVAAVEATHRALCLAMHRRHAPPPPPLAATDFARLYADKTTEQVSHEKKTKFVLKRSPEWYDMAGEKIAVVIRSLASLAVHEHYRVRRELAVLCYRILDECRETMQPSVPTALDVLISMSKDEYPQVSQYCEKAVRTYLSSKQVDTHRTMEGLTQNLFAILNNLPKLLNDVDVSRKLSALNLLHGYIEIMCTGRPQRLTAALSEQSNLQCCCEALIYAASIEPLTSLAQHATRDVSAPPPLGSPWSCLRLVPCPSALKASLQALGRAESAELLADALLLVFQHHSRSEVVFILNCMVAADGSPVNLARRVLNTYIEEDVWYLPLAVGGEPPLTKEETLDVSVYNPRAWSKDSVPDLYEGSVETRYTDIPYLKPRVPPHRDPNSCATLAEAQRNMVLSCLLTEGVGIIATRLKEEFQPFLLKTLCLVLERVGSKYEMLHLAGLKAINDIAIACGLSSVAELIQHNADYFTNQVTLRLKKAWNSQSALQILSVVMEYSDATVLDCLYGIVDDVLVQSCDKYYENNLESYLQVFLTFIQCIRKWFPDKAISETKQGSVNPNAVLLQDVYEFVNNKEESEKLLSETEFEKESGKSIEEMYREDVKRKEDDLLDYDDRVTEEKLPLPQHTVVAITILKRCINFISSRNRGECILALQVMTNGFHIIMAYEDELLPLVHQTWGPLVARFEAQEPVVMKKALDLLVVMAELSKDFIRRRCVKEILPQIYKYLQKSSLESHLKDAGSAYRSSLAYSVQIAAITALQTLVVDLMLEDDALRDAMHTVSLYLSNKQPKPLQALAVEFFKILLEYDYGATWHHLRKLCNNDSVIEAPNSVLELNPIVGTPYESANKDYVNNIKLIWDKV